MSETQESNLNKTVESQRTKTENSEYITEQREKQRVKGEYEKTESSLEDIKNFDTDNATEIFNKGFDRAKKYGKSKNITLTFQGSGFLAKGFSFGPKEVNPIEYLEVWASKKGVAKRKHIGTILPEKEHLTLLKTSEEVYQQIKEMVDNYDQGKEAPTTDAHNVVSSRPQTGEINRKNYSIVKNTPNYNINVSNDGTVMINGLNIKIDRNSINVAKVENDTNVITFSEQGSYIIIDMENDNGTSSTHHIDTDMVYKGDHYLLQEGRP